MAYIFVSHATPDLADIVQQQLDAAGFATVASPGEGWREWIDAALRESFVVLAVQTPESALSALTAYEWAFACGAGIPVIPLRYGPVEMHPRLAALPGFEMANEPPWDDLIARVREIAAQYSARALDLPPDAAQGLNQTSPAERAAAVARLDRIELLHAALHHPVYADVRRAAVEKISQISGLNCTGALIEALGDSDSDVQHAAALALQRVGPPAIPLLTEAVTASQRNVRRGAVWVLATLDHPDTAAGLIKALAVRDWFVPRTAAITLGRRKEIRAVPDLIEALRSEDEHLRRVAAAALAAIDTPDARAALAAFEG